MKRRAVKSKIRHRLSDLVIQPKRASILFTAVSFLFICALLYTTNLTIYQTQVKSIDNIRRAYEAQTLAILAKEYISSANKDKPQILIFSTGRVKIEERSAGYSCQVGLVDTDVNYQFDC